MNQLNTKPTELFLLTIGYQKKKPEQYIAALRAFQIDMLVDVRYNPFSRVTGFMKEELKKICNKNGINYLHFPFLGVKGEHRQNLKTKADYQNLLASHKEEVIDKNHEHVKHLFQLLEDKKRIALTCYESSHEICHRALIANAILDVPETLYGENQQVVNIQLFHY